MVRQSRKIQFIILLTLVSLVGTLTIAYAVLSTTLNITGNTEVIASNWNVHFANINTNPMSVTPTKSPTITDSKTIDFSVTLNKPGDFYKFNVDIVNDGSINAMIDNVIKNPTLTEQQAKYIKYEIEYINGESISTKQLLASGETKTISVLLSYRTDITASDLPTTPTTLNLSIELNYVQADQTSTEITTTPKKINIVSGDLNTVGSEICIGEECFYLFKNDGINAVMLAKYNLLVGNKYDQTNGATPLEKTTGIQDETARGWHSNYSSSSPNIAVIQFSQTNYWNTENILNSKYGSNYPAYIYDSNSLLYSYMNNYKQYLQTKISNLKIRLISKEEVEQLGCEVGQGGCKNNQYTWVYQTTYWTGSAGNYNGIWGIYQDGSLSNSIYANNDRFGIRPVIEIPLTEF